MKFTQEVKDKWITALESGAYEKGTGKLRYDDKYCCIGVLVEIMDNVEIHETEDKFVSTVGLEHDSYQRGGLGLDFNTAIALVKLNDVNYKKDKTFENMIPHIKELEVEL